MSGQIEDGRRAAYHLGMRPCTALGQYLRARRGLVRPEDVGLPHGGRRRVPGLRREELATLAGISADYYLRLEQGRDHHPSAQVIDARARALQLDADATAHLHTLSHQISARPLAEREQAPASIESLIASWPITPAFVHGRHMDILAANSLAITLSPAFRPGANLVRALFMDPDLRTLLIEDGEHVSQSAVARLRVLVGPDVDDPNVAELVGELSAHSDRFRRLWARHDIRVSAPRTTVYNHPLVGRLELKPERLAILGVGVEGQVVIVLHAEPGSPSERALLRLARIAAGEHHQHA
jgi:transcriptional regulator with XRE-family HTH domain